MCEIETAFRMLKPVFDLLRPMYRKDCCYAKLWLHFL